MRLSWKLGRVLGIDVYLHSTFLILLAWLGATQGGLETVLLVSAVFGCVLLHELGHALTARGYGIETEDITLYPIGGVARLHRLPHAPGAELLIALAGPAVNFVIAGALWLVLAVMLSLGLTGWLTWFLATLMTINVILAVFNLIPAFPMDGGRVVRALLSGPLGRMRATEIAAAIGQGLALIFGIVSLFQGVLLHVLLAAFIYFVARMELAQVRQEEWLRRRGQATGSPSDSDQGLWIAPPGYRWANQGAGVWQLVPVTVPAAEPGPTSAASGGPRPWH